MSLRMKAAFSVKWPELVFGVMDGEVVLSAGRGTLLEEHVWPFPRPGVSSGSGRVFPVEYSATLGSWYLFTGIPSTSTGFRSTLSWLNVGVLTSCL